MPRIDPQTVLAAFHRIGAIPGRGQLFEGGGDAPPLCCGIGALVAAQDPAGLVPQPSHQATIDCQWLSQILGVKSPVYVAGFIHGWDQIGLRGLAWTWKFHLHYGLGMDDGLASWTACRAELRDMHGEGGH